MITRQELVTQIRQVVTEGNLEEVFNLFSEGFAALDTATMNDVNLLEAQFNALRKSFFRQGIIERQEYNSEIARITLAILELLSKYELKNNSPIKKVEYGKLLHTIPSQMIVGVETKIIVRLAYDEETLKLNLSKAVTGITQTIRMSDVMAVEVCDMSNPSDASFQIRTLNKSEQFVETNEFTQWIFVVKPLKSGKIPLLLRISVIEIINNKERSREIVLEKEIFISADSLVIDAELTAIGNSEPNYLAAASVFSGLSWQDSNWAFELPKGIVTPVSSAAIVAKTLAKTALGKASIASLVAVVVKNLTQTSLGKVSIVGTVATVGKIITWVKIAITTVALTAVTALIYKSVVPSEADNIEETAQKDLATPIRDTVSQNFYSVGTTEKEERFSKKGIDQIAIDTDQFAKDKEPNIAPSKTTQTNIANAQIEQPRKTTVTTAASNLSQNTEKLKELINRLTNDFSNYFVKVDFKMDVKAEVIKLNSSECKLKLNGTLSYDLNLNDFDNLQIQVEKLSKLNKEVDYYLKMLPKFDIDYGYKAKAVDGDDIFSDVVKGDTIGNKLSNVNDYVNFKKLIRELVTLLERKKIDFETEKGSIVAIEVWNSKNNRIKLKSLQDESKYINDGYSQIIIVYSKEGTKQQRNFHLEFSKNKDGDEFMLFPDTYTFVFRNSRGKVLKVHKQFLMLN